MTGPLAGFMHTGDTAAVRVGKTGAAVCADVRGDGMVFGESYKNPDAAPSK